MTDTVNVPRERVARAICDADAEMRGWDRNTSWSNWRGRYLDLADAAMLAAAPKAEPVSETSVIPCPQCEGEGEYADGLDEAACSTPCTRCKGNGWIVDLAASPEAPKAEPVDAELYLKEAISSSPQPLRDLGEFLSSVLDEDHWKTADRFLLAIATSQPEAPKVEQEPVGKVVAAHFKTRTVTVAWDRWPVKIGSSVYTYPAPASDELLSKVIGISDDDLEALRSAANLEYYAGLDKWGEALERIYRRLSSIAKHKGPQS